MNPLKAEQLTNSKWRVLAIPFGGPFKGGKDSDGEYFSARTDIKPDWFPARPLLFHHGQDPLIKDETLGMADDLEKKDDGWWVTAWMNRANQYWNQVNALLAAGKMFGSSGSVPHLAKYAKDGEILVWPYIEQTFTPTPANYFSKVVPAKADEHFSTAGIALGADLDAYLSAKSDGEALANPELHAALLELRGDLLRNL